MLKNITKITTIVAIALFAISCEKENPNPISSSSTASSTSEANGKQIADNVLAQSYAKLATFTKEDWVDKATPLKAQLEVNGKLYNDKSGTPVPLEDIFFLHEGVINSIYTSIANPGDEVEIYSTELEVEVYEEGETYFIAISDYNSFYSALVNNLTSQVSTSNGEYLTMTDLELVAVSGNFATIRISAFVATPPVTPVFYPIPMGEVHGTDLAGWCVTTSTGFDAATFFNGHIAPIGAINTSGSNCPNSTTRFILPMGTYNTSNQFEVQAHNLNWNTELNKIWKDNTNSCIGNNNNQNNNNSVWTSWYNKSASAVNAPISFYSQYVTLPTSHAVFMHGTIISVSPSTVPPGQNSTLIGNTYFHEGFFFYGIEFC